MTQLVIEVETGKTSLDEIRGEVDATVARHFPAELLKWRWEEDVLHITGPGAQGTMVFDAGRLRVEATLKPPASLMRPVIEHKIRSAFADAFGAAGDGASQAPTSPADP
ncbi:MAG: polyhydroxyalkanoic acid system family protein [Acidobacteriota bacterium]